MFAFKSSLLLLSNIGTYQPVKVVNIGPFHLTTTNARNFLRSKIYKRLHHAYRQGEPIKFCITAGLLLILISTSP